MVARRILGSLLLAAAVMGCGDAPITVSGTYTGQMAGNFGNAPITFALTQHGDRIGGTWGQQVGQDQIGSVNFRLSGSKLTGTMSQGTCGDLTVSADVGDDGHHLSGQLSGVFCGASTASTLGFDVDRQ